MVSWDMFVIPATPADIPQLVALINSAYRGEASKKGWTTEADLLKGELRTDIPSLFAALNKQDAVILKHISENGDITGCVYLHKQERGLYLGMLSVSPLLQGDGIGKKLLAAAELFGKEKNCSSILMYVLTPRHDLIAWYEKQGYRQTSERIPFPNDPRFGVPAQPLEFLIMIKELNQLT